MTIIQFDDPIISKIIKQEGIENITNDVIEYIKNKFTSNTYENDLQQSIQDFKNNNIVPIDNIDKYMKDLEDEIK